MATKKAGAPEPEGGTVTIRTHICEPTYNVAIEDTSCGLPEPCTVQIFEPCYQCPDHAVASGVQTRGAGLGLAIVKGLVEAQGGLVTAENRQEGGTAFRFSVPLTLDNAEPALGRRTPVSRNHESKT
jgi:two-component system sensor histidine kinase KdpD